MVDDLAIAGMEFDGLHISASRHRNRNGKIPVNVGATRGQDVFLRHLKHQIRFAELPPSVAFGAAGNPLISFRGSFGDPLLNQTQLVRCEHALLGEAATIRLREPRRHYAVARDFAICSRVSSRRVADQTERRGLAG
jgi:hypothetical protein